MSKILFIHHSGLIGGAGITLMNNLAYLSSCPEHKVIAAVPTEPPQIYNLIKEQCPGVEIVPYGRRIGAITYYSGGDSIYSLRFWYRLLLIFKQSGYWDQMIETINPDTIVVCSKILCWMSQICAVKKRNSIILVQETINGNRNNFINKKISKSLNRFSKAVFISEYDKKYELSTTAAYVIYNSIYKSHLDNSVQQEIALTNLCLKEGPFYVLFVGGVSELKGFDLAVLAILRAGPEYHLLVAGNDFQEAKKTRVRASRKYADHWERWIQENDRCHQIHILGKQSAMSNCFAASNALLFPMREAHQARPVFEAGYFKKPVIITAFENISEFVEDGFNGFTVTAESVDEIVEKLRILREDSALCSQMGINNFQLCRKNHDPQANNEKFEALVR